MSGIIGHRGLLLNIGAPSSSSYAIEMDFEGADGSTTFTDTGTAGTAWSRSGSDIAIRTSGALAGSSSLKSTSSSAYLTASAVSANMLPASGDWELSVRAQAAAWASGGLGGYILSIQDSTASAAGTQFGLATNASRNLLFVLSDGTTRSVVLTSPGTLGNGTAYDLEVSRSGSTLTMKVNGSTVATATYAASINVPSGREWRIGKPEASVPSIYADWLVDSLRLSK